MKSERMQNALDLAAKCWSSAMKTDPEFVTTYLSHAEELLMTKPQILGDEFRGYCAEKRLFRPAKMHHNVWVSGVQALHSLGWIRPIKKVVPSQSHNHMPEVTLWKSMIYDGDTPPTQKDFFGVDNDLH